MITELTSVDRALRWNNRSLTQIRGERTWTMAIERTFGKTSSELSFPSILGKKSLNSEERAIYLNPS